MFRYLERLLGKTSRWYEMIMRSKEEQHHITETQITHAVEALKPLVIHAQTFSYAPSDTQELPLTKQSSWPLNNKKYPLPYYGALQTNTHVVNLFVNEEKLDKDDSNIFIEVLKRDQAHTASKLTPNDVSLLQNKHYHYKDAVSLPIWEELIHRDVMVHKKIVALAPKNPWTLYKKAKKQVVPHESAAGYIHGYPQWLVNDQDYRKIKDLDFICQITLTARKLTYFVFMANESVHIVRQQ